MAVKSAHDGFRQSIARTLSAFANTPGGGQLIFGMSQGEGFAITGAPATGSVRDQAAYPPIVIRELAANALIHRDLSAAALNQPVRLRLSQGEGLLFASPRGPLRDVDRRPGQEPVES
ncbi:MAG: hypothetical protein LBO20_00880, partial [Bifidobacteriaceae bacterium]|nr:hypothetical protein [Bifidobacteriaceae bacterium]